MPLDEAVWLNTVQYMYYVFTVPYSTHNMPTGSRASRLSVKKLTFHVYKIINWVN